MSLDMFATFKIRLKKELKPFSPLLARDEDIDWSERPDTNFAGTRWRCYGNHHDERGPNVEVIIRNSRCPASCFST